MSSRLVILPLATAYNLSTPRPVLMTASWWYVLRNVLSELADLLFNYQRSPADDELEAKLGQVLNEVLNQRVQPIIAKKLRPDDISDVISEVAVAFWRYRNSIRPDEVGRFIHAVAHRKLVDQIRSYYRSTATQLSETSTSAGELLDILPASNPDKHEESDQKAWELLCACPLSAQDQLVAYFVFLGVRKGEIARALGISPNTVTNALKRSRNELAAAGYKPQGGQS